MSQQARAFSFGISIENFHRKAKSSSWISAILKQDECFGILVHMFWVQFYINLEPSSSSGHLQNMGKYSVLYRFYYQCKMEREIDLEHLNHQLDEYLKVKRTFEIGTLSYEEAI